MPVLLEPSLAGRRRAPRFRRKPGAGANGLPPTGDAQAVRDFLTELAEAHVDVGQGRPVAQAVEGGAAQAGRA